MEEVALEDVITIVVAVVNRIAKTAALAAITPALTSVQTHVARTAIMAANKVIILCLL